MSLEDTNAFSLACTNLVGQVAANIALTEAILSALETGALTASSGPIGISNVLKGAPGSHYLKELLKAWNANASHLSPQDVTGMIKSSIACYRLAIERSHTVDVIWTGPEVKGSEVRRTGAVVNEIATTAKKELLIVGYWLVTGHNQIKTLIDIFIQRARAGVQVRFVFDPGDKTNGPNNFSALNAMWPRDLKDAPLEVFSWSDKMTKATSKSGQKYDRKLHAKVIVADRHDALVTSANLTFAGLHENLEMGLRVQGIMAGAVVRHFDLLIQEGVIVQLQ